MGEVAEAWGRWERARDALRAAYRETRALTTEGQPSSRPVAVEAREAWKAAQAAMKAWGAEHKVAHFERTFPHYWEAEGIAVMASSFPPGGEDHEAQKRRAQREKPKFTRGRKPKAPPDE